jgi:hypothetical protein
LLLVYHGIIYGVNYILRLIKISEKGIYKTSKLQYHEYNNIDVIPQKRTFMNIHDYVTAGGKNLIKEYISTRPMDE